MKDIRVFDFQVPVSVDWEYALAVAETIDKTAEADSRKPLKGKAAVNVLAEYGAIAHHCSFPPQNTKLAIIIAHPFVWFCPSSDGVNGVFIEPYSEQKHGLSFCSFEKQELFDYTNINARLDAWNFYALIIDCADQAIASGDDNA